MAVGRLVFIVLDDYDNGNEVGRRGGGGLAFVGAGPSACPEANGREAGQRGQPRGLPLRNGFFSFGYSSIGDGMNA
jgi:hypothetical protein